MNLDSLSFALSQISYLVANLTKKNYKSSVAEISHLVVRHGAEADRHLFRCLFSHVDFSGDVGKNSGKDFHQTQYLIAECGSVLRRLSVVSTLCYAIDNPLHHQKSLKASSSLLPQLSRILKLNAVQEVVFGLALLSSVNTELRHHAATFVGTKLPPLLNSYIQSDKSGSASGGDNGLRDAPPETLHLILANICQPPSTSSPVTTELKESFIKALHKDYPAEKTPVVLQPLLYPALSDTPLNGLAPLSVSMPKTMLEISLAELIHEAGYTVTSSLEECRTSLLTLGIQNINSNSVARCLAMMTRTCTGLTDSIQVQGLMGTSTWLDGKEKPDAMSANSWNVDIFVQVVKDLAPHISWRDVVLNLDHPGFVVPNKLGLRLLMSGLVRAIQDVFPIGILYQQWKNTDGQLSWIAQSLKNPDVVCLSDYMLHSVNTEILKTPPDEDNRDIATWKSLSLVEALLRLSEAGHFQQVSELFKFPMQHCPDMLVLALLQIPTWNTMKQELLAGLIPVFLNNHPNSGIVLPYAWHCQGQSTTIRTLIMHAMAEWYMREHHDQTRLSRILDVAQDLKALSMLLNATPYAFVIDLACLANRREYLKLDKWLSDKIREHGEPFLTAAVNFLKRRCPQLAGAAGLKPDPRDSELMMGKVQQLSPDVMANMLTCIQAYVGTVSQELSESIVVMVNAASMLLSKRPPAAANQPGNKPALPPSSMPPLTPSTLPPDTHTSMPSMPNSTIPGFPASLPGLTATTPQSPVKNTQQFGPPGGSVIGPPPPVSAPQLGPLSAQNTSSPHKPANIVNIPPNFNIPSSNNQFQPGLPNLASQLQGTPYDNTATPGSPNKFGGIGPPGASSVGHIGPPGTSSQGQPFNAVAGLQSLQGGQVGSPGKFAPGAGVTGLGQPATSETTTSNPANFGQAFNPAMQGLGGAGLASQLQSLSLAARPAAATSTNSAAGLSGLPGTSIMKPTGTGLRHEGLALPPPASQTGDASSIFPHGSQQFSKEIEDEANSYFQRIYNHPPHPTISIDEVLDMLKRFKDSLVKKEKDVFSCMLRNLFEEYRFFSQYPERELNTTAVLFGGIIEQGLVTYMDLGIALRYVLEALKKAHGSKMYFFGIAALDRFKTRLKDYPQYCQHLASIPHFSQFPEHLIEYVEFGSRSAVPPNPPVANPITSLSMAANNATSTPATTTTTGTPATSSLTPTVSTPSSGLAPGPSKTTAASKPSIANATNIDTLLAGTDDSKEEVVVPPEAVQDKVFFIFNNLSLSNMEQKATELKEYVTTEYTPWVSQYLVMKRSSIEPNFHTLYASFIDHLQIENFAEMVVRETYRNIRVLLRSDKGVANFSDRSLLKNLGHWLGMLTLAKNRPILHGDIDVKSLLYEAYHKGAQELLYVVPFVAKVIESCSKSRVFTHPNPWTMGIMNALSELHQEPDLKLNLKFEIEVLCKTLNIDIQKDLTAGSFLKSPDRLQVLENQLSAPIARPRLPDAVTPVSGVPVPTVATPPTTVQQDQDAAAQAAAAAGLVGLVAPPTQSVVRTPPTTMPTSTPSVTAPPQPQFNYHDINVLSLTGLGQHLAVNDQLGLFQAHPQLKQFVRGAIELAVQDLLPPVVERSIKIALTTCEQIVKKDFALDPDESHLRAAAHHMVRNMTAGMALITCREPLLIAINTNIKKAFMTALRGATQPQKELMEQAAQVLAQDNTELACAFIQKTAVEKALPEIDKKLLTEFELRKQARQEGRRYCDPVVLTYQAERMPEQIRLKVGGVTPQQIAVYEEFARNIPGFLPTQQEQHQQVYGGHAGKPINNYVADDVSVIYDKILLELEQHLHAILTPPASSPQVVQMHALREAVLLARNSRDIIYVNALLQKAVEGLLDGLSSALSADAELMLRFRDCHLLVLRGLADHRAYGPAWTNKQVTRWLMECREDYRYNPEAMEVLIRSHLVHLAQYDVHLATAMENGLNYPAVAFAMQLLQRFCMDEKQGQDVMTEFSNTVEMLARIAAHSRQAPEGRIHQSLQLTALIETIRQRLDGGLLERGAGGGAGGGGPTSMMHSGISQVRLAREFDDPPGLHEKTEYLLREWVNMYHSPQAGRDSTKAFSTFVGQMHSQGILKTDELITRFFRLCTEMCVDLCYRAQTEHPHSPTLVRAKSFHTVDAFVRLIALLVKHSGDTANTVTKINLLNKVLGIVAGVLLQDHEVRNTEFQQLPYHRIFIMLFIELNAPETVLESINYQVLTAFCNTYHILRPAKAPGFAYAWLELVSHRVFIGRMLAITPQQKISTVVEDRKGWNMYAQLLIDLFKFLAPFLRNAELTKPTQLLYKGTLRVLLVLLHDFPELLCDYHYAFCDVIPPNCIQMRNLILSAFPRNMRLPDPFTPNLKVDILGEIQQPPRIMTNFASLIHPATFKKDLDSYLKTRSPVTFLSELRSNLQISNEPGQRYDIHLINALVLYVGNQAISYIHTKNQTPSMSTIAHSSHMDIFQNLAVDLDTEGRYLFLNAIANQLRYPNSHTHYFSCAMLYLFAEANSECIQEQITRVLLERLIVNRPHPWGLLITFIELIKNPQFKFWNHEFVHCAQEIEKLFESVARSCMHPRQAQTMREEGAAQEAAH